MKAQLTESAQALGSWEFSLFLKGSPPTLKLSPLALDQCFLTVDHPYSSPVAVQHQFFSLPDSLDNVRLHIVLLLPGQQARQQEVYHLRWPSKEAAAQRLQSWRRARMPAIEWFYVELTTFCNLSCPFCPSSILQRPRASMSLPLARKIFEQIGHYRETHLPLLGYARLDPLVFLHVMGEPLIHPHFEEIVAIAKEYGITPALFTNVTLLNTKNIEKILGAGISHVTLSYNVVNADGYAQLGAKGNLAAQERRVVNLLRRRAERRTFNLNIDLQYITSHGRLVAGQGLLKSRQQVWKLYNRWLTLARHLEEEAGGSTLAVEPVDPRSITDPLVAENNGDASMRIPIASGLTLAVKSGCSFGNAMLPPGYSVIPAQEGSCPYNNPWRVMCIFVDGSVSFCSLDYENSVSLGNVNDESIEAVWTSSRLHHIRNQMEQGYLQEPLCQNCLGKVVRTADHA